MSSFPAETEKLIPADRLHIDFVRKCSNGSYRGIRVRESTCIFIETETGFTKPKTLHEVGLAYGLGSRTALPPAFEIELEILVGNYPELVELLNGTRILSEAFS